MSTCGCDCECWRDNVVNKWRDSVCQVFDFFVPQKGCYETHSNGISPFLIGNTSSEGPVSIAMLDYRSIIFYQQVAWNTNR